MLQKENQKSSDQTDIISQIVQVSEYKRLIF